MRDLENPPPPLEPGGPTAGSLRRLRLDRDQSDLLFRLLFCLIFLGLGGEHLVADTLIRRLMPGWVPYPRLISVACGLWLVSWGSLLLLGWRIRWAANALAAFLVGVTLMVHLPGLFLASPEVSLESLWIWEILQRSNLVKNLCLLGVCIQLQHHRVGRYSLTEWLKRRARRHGYPRARNHPC